MKVIIIVLLTDFLLQSQASTQKDLWLNFKQTHNKFYKNLNEEKLRYEIFLQNLEKIRIHNERYEAKLESYSLGVTKFADLTPAEFTKNILTYLNLNNPKPINIYEKRNAVVPDYFDWRTKGVVTQVKDQMQCNGCWAFSATGALEGQYAIKHSKIVTLSEQELIDCSQDYGTIACLGGRMEYAFNYVKDHGMATEEDYPFLDELSQCLNSTTERSDVVVTGYTTVQPDENSLKEAVAMIGPISAAINANSLYLYKEGIFDPTFCSHEVNHAVLIVGYGTTDDGKDYWIIKNSWGENWGENGYMRMARNKNLCGIDLSALYPNVR